MCRSLATCSCLRELADAVLELAVLVRAGHFDIAGSRAKRLAAVDAACGAELLDRTYRRAPRRGIVVVTSSAQIRRRLSLHTVDSQRRVGVARRADLTGSFDQAWPYGVALRYARSRSSSTL
jgi:hypothetical protein